MSPTPGRSVAGYLATLPAATRLVVDRVRAVIRKALPRAAEVSSYGIIGYRQDEGMVLYLAGWKEHYSLYPATAGLVERLGPELAGHLVSKGTIRFALRDRVPVGLIRRIALIRAEETVHRLEEKKARRALARPRRSPRTTNGPAVGRSSSSRPGRKR